MGLACGQVLYTLAICPAQGRTFGQALPPGGPWNLKDEELGPGLGEGRSW